MANNFFNKIARNISSDLTAPTSLYSVPASKKTIVIELDVGNSSTAAQTISVLIEDYSARSGADIPLSNGVAISSNTLTAASAHSLQVNDRIKFSNVTGLTGITTTPVYFVQSTPSASTFTLGTVPSATSAVTCSGTQATANVYKEYVYAYIVKDAPIPIGGALKVIAGQKLVLEAQDSLLITAASSNSIDAIGSILEDVS